MTAISHIVFGDSAFSPGRIDLKHFAIGFVLNVMAMIGWSSLTELGFQALNVDSHRIVVSATMAIAVAVLAYFTDFHIVPKRFTPGFEHILSRRALFVTYFFLALSFFIGGMCRVT